MEKKTKRFLSKEISYCNYLNRIFVFSFAFNFIQRSKKYRVSQKTTQSYTFIFLGTQLKNTPSKYIKDIKTSAI